MKKLSLEISGMHCDACVDAVRRALRDTPGVIACDVRIGAAELTHQPSAAVPDIVEAVRHAGAFDVTSFTRTLQ
jgi:copper chaperone